MPRDAVSRTAHVGTVGKNIGKDIVSSFASALPPFQINLQGSFIEFFFHFEIINISEYI